MGAVMVRPALSCGGMGGVRMAKTRREFSPEFKREAVALLESSGRPLRQVATELDISPLMLRTWRAAVWGVTSVMCGCPLRVKVLDRRFQQGRCGHVFGLVVRPARSRTMMS